MISHNGDFLEEAWGDYFFDYWNNPYNVESVWTVYIQESNDVLIGGAIATDTTQPTLFRNLTRLLADGSHDTDFPAIEAFPNNPYSCVMKIHKASTGYWYISGPFQGINGHATNHIARLTPEFEVDTDFVSPIEYQGITSADPNVKFIDDQDRLWVAGDVIRLTANPEDTLKLVRILPDGGIDESLNNIEIEANYPSEWQANNLIISGVEKLNGTEDYYILWGGFNYVNDTLQRCITVINDAGYIQDNYFMGDGPTQNDWGGPPSQPIKYPAVSTIEQLPDGDLLIGGGFSDFMGEEHYSLVKLNLGTVGVDEKYHALAFDVFPNPATDKVRLVLPANSTGRVSVLNSLGQKLQSQNFSQSRIDVDVSGLAAGVYVVLVETGEGVGTRKIIIN